MPKKYRNDDSDEVTSEYDVDDNPGDAHHEPTQILISESKPGKPEQRPVMQEYLPPRPAKEVVWQEPKAPAKPSSYQYYFEDRPIGRAFNLFTFVALVLGLLFGFIGRGLVNDYLPTELLQQTLQKLKTKTAEKPKEPQQNKRVETPQKSNIEPPEEIPKKEPKNKPEKKVVDKAVKKQPKATPTPQVAKAKVKKKVVRKKKPQPRKTAVKKKPARPKVPLKLIKDVSIFKGPTFVKVGIHTGGHKVSYSSEILTSPFRLVLDIKGVNGTQTANKIDVNAGLLETVRVRKRSDSSVRIVFDFFGDSRPRYIISAVDTGLSVLVKK